MSVQPSLINTSLYVSDCTMPCASANITYRLSDSAACQEMRLEDKSMSRSPVMYGAILLTSSLDKEHVERDRLVREQDGCARNNVDARAHTYAHAHPHTYTQAYMNACIHECMHTRTYPHTCIQGISVHRSREVYNHFTEWYARQIRALNKEATYSSDNDYPVCTY